MTEWKLPPRAKTYEGLSAVAGGRVHLVAEAAEKDLPLAAPTTDGANGVGPAGAGTADAGTAEVTSSCGDKVYTVEWTDGMRRITSNDNASYWQGYAGYPLIAVLLATGRIGYDPEVVAPLAGVPWKRINDRFKRDYERAVESVLDEVEAKGGDRAAIVAEADRIYDELAALHLERGPRRRPPRKRTSPTT